MGRCKHRRTLRYPMGDKYGGHLIWCENCGAVRRLYSDGYRWHFWQHPRRNDV